MGGSGDCGCGCGIVQEVYEFISIDPHATVGLWIHGYTEQQYVSFSIIPRLHSNEPPAAVTVRASLNIAETGTHPDGWGRLLYITNDSVGPQAFISCKVYHFIQDIQ